MKRLYIYRDQKHI